MQSFASPTHTNPPPHKNHAPHFIPRPTKRAQLSPIPTPFLPKNPQKGRNYRLYPRPFYPKNHRKGATIAYTYALSTQKSRERAQLSPMPQEKSLLNPLNPCEPSPTHTKRAQLSLIPTPFLPKKPQKGRNYRLYLRPFYQKIHRKGATIGTWKNNS